MYHHMTSELLKICPALLVCQEGGYNTDFLGQHASGVVSALLGEQFIEPTQADIDAGFTKLDEIKEGKPVEWAVKNVEETRECLQAFWKV
jgi:acetoin utilization deacetylase AcuC-like enzyme